MPDMRFGGRQYIHTDGWNRAFADGHGAFLLETAPLREAEAERIILANTANGGEVAGHTAQHADYEENLLYPTLAIQR